MVTTEKQPTTTRPQPAAPRRRALLVAVIVLGLIGAATVAVILMDGEGDAGSAATPEDPGGALGASVAPVGPVSAEPGTPEAVMEQLVLAARAADPSIPADLVAPLDAAGRNFLEWNLALGMEPEFSDCVVMSAGQSGVAMTCAVTMGEQYFFSRLVGANLPTSVTAAISDEAGTLAVGSWPPPVGLVAAESDLREWIRAVHPDAEGAMFGNDYAGVVRFSREAGELHSRYLDEYLAYVATPPTVEEVMQRLTDAVEAIDREQFAGLTPPLGVYGPGFLEWNLALGMDPEFTECSVVASGGSRRAVRCAVSMGEEYFFSRVAGENEGTIVTGSVSTEDGTLTISDWPAPIGLADAENDLREWVRATHPDDVGAMFGADYAGVVRFSKEAGELHAKYADEYLDYLAEQG